MVMTLLLILKLAIFSLASCAVTNTEMEESSDSLITREKRSGSLLDDQEHSFEIVEPAISRGVRGMWSHTAKERWYRDPVPGKTLWGSCEWTACTHSYKRDEEATCRVLNKMWVNVTHLDVRHYLPLDFQCPTQYYTRQMCCLPQEPYALETCKRMQSCVWSPSLQPGKKAECRKMHGDLGFMFYVFKTPHCGGGLFEEYCCKCFNRHCKPHLTSSLFGLPPRKKDVIITAEDKK